MTGLVVYCQWINAESAQIWHRVLVMVPKRDYSPQITYDNRMSCIIPPLYLISYMANEYRNSHTWDLLLSSPWCGEKHAASRFFSYPSVSYSGGSQNKRPWTVLIHGPNVPLMSLKYVHGQNNLAPDQFPQEGGFLSKCRQSCFLLQSAVR